MTYNVYQLIIKTFPSEKTSKIILEILTVDKDEKNHQYYFGEITIGQIVTLTFNKEEFEENETHN